MITVWDTQTGVAIGKIYIQIGYASIISRSKVVFHGDQRTITLFTHSCSSHNWVLYTQDALNGTQLCQVTIPSQTHFTLDASWAYRDTLQFAMGVAADRKSMINIYELQPTSASPLHTVSSFPIPFHITFSFHKPPIWDFSSVSLHASFILEKELIVLDVQGSKILLKTRGAQVNDVVPPCFSADGNFVACITSENRLCVWQNKPTGYVLWCSLRARLPFSSFSWSPTSVSIICWGLYGIQVLHLGNPLSPISPNESEPSNKGGNHLVAYSADKAHIAIAKQFCHVVTVLDSLSGTPQQVINTDMQIKDTKIFDNTIIVIDGDKLVSWGLEKAGVVHCGYSDERVINESLIIEPYAKCLKLSHDCSQIAYTKNEMLCIYNIQTQKTLKYSIQFDSFQFSPSGHELWAISYEFLSLSFRKLGTEDKWSKRLLFKGGRPEEERPLSRDEWLLSQLEAPEDEWEWMNLFSCYGYCIEWGSEWITNSRGSKVLWLPPVWRTKDWEEVRWDDNFLAFLGHGHPKPMIIEFKPH